MCSHSAYGPRSCTSTKLSRRVPDLDARAPAHRHAVQLQPVVDQRALAHLDRAGCGHAEAQPRRRDRLEVARLAVELECALDGTARRWLRASTWTRFTALVSQRARHRRAAQKRRAAARLRRWPAHVQRARAALALRARRLNAPRRAVLLLAAGELVADKLPAMPSRLARRGLPGGCSAARSAGGSSPDLLARPAPRARRWPARSPDTPCARAGPVFSPRSAKTPWRSRWPAPAPHAHGGSHRPRPERPALTV